MKKSILVCALLGIFCQASFAATLGAQPMFAVGPKLPEIGSTLGLLAAGMAGMAVIARKRKQ